jgi:hypothetical protein
MTEDGPVCDVRDFPEGMTVAAIGATDPEWRTWSFAALAWGAPREGHSRGPECKPGAPCAKCQAQAQRWWWEHGKRTKEQWFRAACDAGKNRTNGWRADEWGQRRETREAATADAVERGWTWVVMSDGHGRQIEWMEVSNG